MPVEIAGDDCAKIVALAFQRVQLVRDDQFHSALFGESLQLPDTLGRRPELASTMDDGDVRRHFRQRQRPIDRRVAAAGDDYPLIAIVLAPRYEILYATARRLALEALDAVQRRPIRSECANPRRDDDGCRVHAYAVRALDAPASAMLRRQVDHLMAEVINGLERRRLFLEFS